MLPPPHCYACMGLTYCRLQDTYRAVSTGTQEAIQSRLTIKHRDARNVVIPTHILLPICVGFSILSDAQPPLSR